VDTIRVLVAAGSGDVCEALSAYLRDGRVDVVGTTGSGLGALAAIEATRPDIALLDLELPDGQNGDGGDGVQATETITARFPWVSVILTSASADPDVLRRAMLAGARHFFIRPLEAEELLAGVRLVYERDATRRASQMALAPAAAVPAALPVTNAQSKEGKIYTFYSAKGGVGCTTLACNLAVTLKQTTGKDVALFDCGLLFGDVGVVLNLNPRQTIVDVIPHIHTGPRGLDPEMLSQIMLTHASGVKVLLAPSSPEKAELITPEHVRRILDALREQFDYVVIDTWPTFEERILHVLDASDKILVPTTLEMPAIKNCKLLLDVTGALSYPPEKVVMVLNRADSRGGIRVHDVEQILGRTFAAEIVSDGQVTTHSLNEGVPFVLSHPSAPITGDIADLARRLTGVAPMPVEARPRGIGMLRGVLGFGT